MRKVRKKFILFAMLSIFVLLTALLGILNGISFTRTAEDADRVTQMLCDGHGSFDQSPPPEQPQGRFGPAWRDTQPLRASIQYFTVGFKKSGDDVKFVEQHLAGLSEDDAVAWARSLKNGETGWTKTVYRYRVVSDDGRTIVTVIDQSRELLSPYRILKISIVGELAVLLIAFFVLLFVSKRLLKPLEETDRKQKRFIAELEQELRVPLTVLDAGTELTEKEHGATDVTRSMRRQIKQMAHLLRSLEALTVLEPDEHNASTFSLSDLCNQVIDTRAADFEMRGLRFTPHIAPGVTLTGDNEGMRKLLDELLENQLKFSTGHASLTLKEENNHVLLLAQNGTDLAPRNAEAVFDRFTRLENAVGHSGAGLGLSYVKDIVKAQGGRISAELKDGTFLIKINL
ncbi:MAG: HAMP domain-containing histidine kinase [Clostridia bacterium]|nr:HAMP domain-containing histidine kinase [Clostridia bacterium]